jgi:DNA polymerase III delta prime subunit
MVKLIFKPNDSTQTAIESKSSKLEPKNLNPFESVEPIQVIKKNEVTTKDLVGLENTRYILNQWYNSSLNDLSKQFLLLIGPTGCGKTSLVELFCKEEDIMLYTVKISEFTKTKKELLRELISFSEYSSVSFFIKNSSNCKKLILIDEYQNGQNDLLGISDIQNLYTLRTGQNKKDIKGAFEVSECKLPPVMIISADSKGSKLSDIKKTNEVYYINEIPISLIKPWVSKKFEIPEKDLLEIIKKCKSDIRLLLNTLSFYKKEKSIDNFMESFYKDEDVNVFEFTNKMFDSLEPLKIDELFKIYETDGYTLASLVQENYLDFNNSIESIANAAEAISLGETIFSDTYESTRSFIPEAHCLNSLCIPSYYSRSEYKKNKCQLRTSCNNNRFNIYLNNKKIFDKLKPASPLDVHYIKGFLNSGLIKTKVLKDSQKEFLKNLLLTFSIEKLEMIYKHFSDFKNTETKTKNFTLKFKEKLKNILNE